MCGRTWRFCRRPSICSFARTTRWEERRGGGERRSGGAGGREGAAQGTPGRSGHTEEGGSEGEEQRCAGGPGDFAEDLRSAVSPGRLDGKSVVEGERGGVVGPADERAQRKELQDVLATLKKVEAKERNKDVREDLEILQKTFDLQFRQDDYRLDRKVRSHAQIGV